MKPVVIRPVDKGIVDCDKKTNFVRRNISFDIQTDKDLNRICLSIVDDGDKPVDRSAFIRALIRYAIDLPINERIALFNQYNDK